MNGAMYPADGYPATGIKIEDSVATTLAYEDALEALSVELVLVIELEVFVSEQVS